MFTGAVFLRLPFPEVVFDKAMALSFHLYTVSTQVTDVPRRVPFAVALTLIAVVLAMNAVAIGFRMRLRGRKKW
jgi:phosphate transport system permease protein